MNSVFTLLPYNSSCRSGKGEQNGSNSYRVMMIMIVCLLVLQVSGFAQNKSYTIKGMVTDAANASPLRGVSLRLTPAAKILGAYSDATGAFSMNVSVAPGTYTITSSFIGYKPAKQTITLADSPEVTVNVSLKEDLVRSEEVVVTGQAGATSRKQLGNAIGTVAARDLQTANTTTLDQALSGKISGALIQQNSGNPSGGVTIRLRGTNTYSGNADPLYIVDGVLINNDSPQLINFGGYQQNRLADLNLNDVERIEVLKGAAAAAIYGSRANNGVVQIFTKSGSFGAPRVSFSTRFQTDELLRKIPMNLVPLVPEGAGSAPFSRMVAGQKSTSSLNLPTSDALSIYNGVINRKDLQDDIFRRGFGTETYLGVDGGSMGTRYSFSATYFGNQGILKGTSYQRTNLRARVEQVLSDWLTITTSMNYSYSNSQELPNEPLGTALGADGYGVMTSLLFAQNFIPAGKDVNGLFPTDTRAFQRGSPLELIEKFDFNQKVNRIIGGLNVKMTPIEGLTIDYITGVDTYSQLATAYIPPGTLAFEYGTGLARAATAQVFQMNNDLSASFSTALAENVQSITQIGGTLQYERRIIEAAQSRGLAPIARVVPAGAIQALPTDSRSEIVLYGAFLQQTFTINNKLVLTGAGRLDASSVFGADNRWQFYPKASVSYLLSDEEFWKNGLGSSINSFKVRAAYGESGGLTSIGAYDRLTTYASSPYGGLPGLATGGRLGTPAIKPERQSELEFGFDMNLLDDKVGVEFTYYSKLTKDVLLSRNLAPTTGFATQLDNVGSLKNNGIEVLVRVTPVQTDGLTWNTTLIVNNNKNEINDIIGGAIIGGQYAAINGFSFPVIYERFYAVDANGNKILTVAGLPQTEKGTLNPAGNNQYSTTDGLNGKINDRNASGQPTGSELRKILGDPNPRWTGSWINELTIEKFTIRAQVDAMLNFQLMNYTRRTSTAFGAHEDFGKELQGTLPAGWAGAVIPIFQEFAEDGDFVRIREISVAYNVGAVESLGIKTARVTLSGRNLALFTGYRGYDPEINSAAQGNLSRGADFSTVPIPRSISVGINLGF